jgi:hypothetical protein
MPEMRRTPRRSLPAGLDRSPVAVAVPAEPSNSQMHSSACSAPAVRPAHRRQTPAKFSPLSSSESEGSTDRSRPGSHHHRVTPTSQQHHDRIAGRPLIKATSSSDVDSSRTEKIRKLFSWARSRDIPTRENPAPSTAAKGELNFDDDEELEGNDNPSFGEAMQADDVDDYDASSTKDQNESTNGLDSGNLPAASRPDRGNDGLGPKSALAALRTAESGDLGRRKSGTFRKKFSRASSNATDGFGKTAGNISSDDGKPRLLERVNTSLLPPNHTSLFTDRSPSIRQTSPVKEEWALDAVAFLNNGIRREVCDMYKMLFDMERRLLVLTVDDMRLFFSWYATFLNIVQTIFHLEERSLYAWIEGKDKMTSEARKWDVSENRVKGELSEARRTLRKGEIMVLAGDVDMDGVGEFVGRPIAVGLVGLSKRIDLFVVALLSYIDAKEAVLPDIIMHGRRLKVKDRRYLEDMFWTCLQKEAQSTRDVALAAIAVTRWMEKSAFSSWKKKYSPTSTKQYEIWKTKFLEHHYSAVKEFEARVLPAEMERLKQMEESHRIRAQADATAPTTFVPGTEPSSPTSSSVSDAYTPSSVASSGKSPKSDLKVGRE